MATASPQQPLGPIHVANPTDGHGNGQTALPQVPPPPQHKRVYQACIPCRRRKVKCDLGSVDNPSDPPCVRCRRESKDCYFSATRRKRKLDGREDSVEDIDVDQDYLIRNGRKRLHSNDSGSEPPPTFVSHSATRLPPVWAGSHSPPLAPLTPGGHIGRTQPLRRPGHSDTPSRSNGDDSNVRMENPEAQDVMRREVYGPHDALDLLYKAATDSPGHKRTRSDTHSLPYPPPNSDYPQLSRSYSQPDTARPMGPPDARKEEKRTSVVASAEEVNEGSNRIYDVGYKDALKAWARFRFVRAGWFTAAEAIEYIEYYYKYLSPLTPISPPTFENPSTHPTLLTEEPILTVTLLTIASRYHTLAGPGGNCRSQAIHEQLWTYLRGMVERCLWGQEAFGGGFCGSGASGAPEGEQNSSTAPWRGLRRGSLRTLGTVESLMILTEWHPRALHFPPAEATDELMLPSYEQADNYSTDDDGGQRVPGGVGGKRIESWLEPAWRSDRMCWMLLSNALGLSYELGVFDKADDLLATGGELTRPEYSDESYRLRAGRIKKLLLIYITQLAGRLGWTNMVPGRENEMMEPRKRRDVDGNTPGTSTSISNAFQYIPNLELDDQIIHCWAGITDTMRHGNEKLFSSRKHTTTIIQNGEYIEKLKAFQPMLKKWWETFEGYQLPQFIRHILTIEYEYVRIYINSLSLQAVVERCTNNNNNPNGSSTGNMFSPETQNYWGKMPLTSLGGFSAADQQYVKEVVDGSRNLLRTVVDGLLPGGYLKHSPVRTYFRIISGAMFLLKTFALGASKTDVEISMNLMDRAVDALRKCVVDDVHLGIRFANLLENLTGRLRTRFMHAPIVTRSNNSVSARHTPPAQQEAAGGPKTEGNNGRHGWQTSTPTYTEQNVQMALNANISATAFDGFQGYMGANTPYGNDPNGRYDVDPNFVGAMDWANAAELWYLPTGPALFQNSDQAVAQTAEGVNVGGFDLLEYMAMDPNETFDAMNGSNHGIGTF